MAAVHDVGDIRLYTAFDQHLFKGTATADNQQHHGNDFDRLGDGFHHFGHGTATIQTKSEDSNQHRNQRGHHRITKEFRVRQNYVAFRQNHFAHRAERHQNYRYQRCSDAHAKAWHLFFGKSFWVEQTFRYRLVDPFQETGKQRASNDHRWHRQQGTVEQRFAHIRVENGGNRGRAWVRRQEAVGNGQRSSHRYADIQQRQACGSSDGEHQRQHQHEAHFIEQRETDDKTGQYYRPLNVLFTKFLDKRGRNTLRTPAVGQHFTEHGTEAHNQRQTAQRAAYPVFNRRNHFVHRHPLHDTYRQRDEDQSNESVEFESDHKQQQ